MNCSKILTVAGVLSILTSCSLDLNPVAKYSDVTEGIDTNVTFPNKMAITTHIESMITGIREGEHFHQDVLLLSEITTDNAYSGNEGGAPPAFEKNDVADMMVKPPLQRDWQRRYNNIGLANKLINNVEHCKDPSLSKEDIASYKAQGLIYRAMLYYDLAQFWGSVPIVVIDAGDITAANIAEAYDKYFPKQNTELEVYRQIEEDLLKAIPDAPVDNGNKMLFSKGLAYALLAHIYCDNTELKDYDKVIDYADKLEELGFGLVDDFSDLFGVKLEKPGMEGGPDNLAVDAKARNTKEGILEIQFTANTGRGNFNSQIFGLLWNTWTPVTFANWVLPTHDIINLFEQEPGDIRYAESIHYYGGTQIGFKAPRDWGYDMDHYPHMFKMRSLFNSNIKYRYADILLLKAEACLLKENPDLKTAADILNKIRHRAGLANLPASVAGSKDALWSQYKIERRKELVFEGFRRNDLVRWKEFETVMNAYVANDKYSRNTVPFTKVHYKFPIQNSVLSSNESLTQIEGY